MVGLLGLPVMILGVAGFVAGMNYDTWFAGQSMNTIGPNQLNAMMGAIVVAGVGVFLTVLGFVRARSPAARESAPLEAPSPEPAESVAVPAAPPVRVVIPEVEKAPARPPEPEPYIPPPTPAASVAPAPAAPSPAARAVEEEEEEEGEMEIPSAAPAAAPSAPVSPPPAPAPDRDELEDLFGELESEVAKAEEEEIHYECPNCHGIVGEDDTTCPHCGVTFEG
jgi:hypothetical protein